MKNELIIFEQQDVLLEVNIKDETVWLNKEQMAMLFKIDRSGISKHINNIYKEEELNSKSTCAKIAHMGNDKNQKYQTKLYNLDVIISVGYRVKSKNGIIFRKWANEIIKSYLLKGYAINQKRLDYLERTVKLIDVAGRIDIKLNGEEAQEIIKIINNYSKALDLLDDYDYKRLKKNQGTKSNEKITYEKCLEIIDKLKFNNESKLFALERDEGLKGIIGNIYQSFDCKDVYPSTQEKASNFLYLVTKNHVFIDGNKRIAASLFIYFLSYYGLLYDNEKQTIDNNTLVALTLLIAQSHPREKEILIDLTMKILSDKYN